jgi:hypothetical protein
VSMLPCANMNSQKLAGGNLALRAFGRQPPIF